MTEQKQTTITDEIIQLSTDLIRFESTKENTPEIRKCVDFVKTYFAGLGLVIKEIERKNKPSLLISFEETLNPQVLMIGHLDVIEANPEQFKAVEREGKLFGRGTYDMKLQNAVCMVLMKKLAEKGDNRDLMLALTTDEEIGGKNGAQFLMEQGLRAEIAFAPDAGEDMRIITKQKGILHLKIKFSGKACHGSRVWKGVNAIDKAVEAIPKIKALFPDTTPDNRWMATCNVGVIHGGDATNKVADWCEVAFDIRYTRATTREIILSNIKSITDGDISIISEGVPLETPDDNPWIQRFRDCSAEILGKPLEIEGSHGASDLRHLADQGILGFLCHVPGDGAHGPEEYVEIDKIDPFYRILDLWVNKYTRNLDG